MTKINDEKLQYDINTEARKTFCEHILQIWL